MKRSNAIFNSDEDIVVGLNAGVETAFSAVYDRFHQRLFHFALKYVEEAEEAEDIVADTFVKCWQKRAEFDSLSSISIFLHVAARNQCFDSLRHARMKASKKELLMRQLQESDQKDLMADLVKQELVQMIFEQVDKLPARMQEIFKLSYHADMKPAEIAAQLELSVQTVSNQKTSAIRLLKEALLRAKIIQPIENRESEETGTTKHQPQFPSFAEWAHLVTIPILLLLSLFRF